MLDAKKKNNGHDDGHQRARHVNVNGLFTKSLVLLFPTEEPTNGSAFHASNEKHAKIDIKVNGVQKVNARVGGIDQARKEASHANSKRHFKS